MGWGRNELSQRPWINAAKYSPLIACVHRKSDCFYLRNKKKVRQWKLAWDSAQPRPGIPYHTPSYCQWVHSHIILSSLGTQKHLSSIFHSYRKGFLSKFPCIFGLFVYRRQEILYSWHLGLVLLISAEALTISWSGLIRVQVVPGLYVTAHLHALPLFQGILYKTLPTSNGKSTNPGVGVFKHNRRELWTVYNSNTSQYAPIQLKKWIIAQYIF